MNPVNNFTCVLAVQFDELFEILESDFICI